MDVFAIIVLLLISFLAWQQGIQWLFVGGIILLILMARSIAITIVVLAGIGGVYFLDLQQYWWIVMCLIAGVVLVISGKKGEAAGGGEFYSPELMKLLGG